MSFKDVREWLFLYLTPVGWICLLMEQVFAQSDKQEEEYLKANPHLLTEKETKRFPNRR